MAVIQSICLAFVLVEILVWHKKLLNFFAVLFNKPFWFNRKPFNCGVCLSGWICLILSHQILMMPIAMIGYIVFEKILHKL